MAPKQVTRWTSRVDGYEIVKIGSNIAARYSASSGEVKDEAMIVPPCGRRFLSCFASELQWGALAR